MAARKLRGKSIADAVEFGRPGAGSNIMNIGTSSRYLEMSSTSLKAFETRVESSAASGDIRGHYCALKFSSTAGGEAGRFRTIVNAASGTAHGVHNGIEFGASGKVTGLAVGARSTLMIPNRALASGGTYYGGMSEIYAAGSNSDIGAVTKHAIHHFGANGNATGAATVQYLWDITGKDATGEMIYTDATATATKIGSLKFLVNGAEWFIHAYDAEG